MPEPEVNHPDLEWAKEVLLERHPDATEEELKTLHWTHMGCYMVAWKGMWLGIETDKHIHS